MFIAVLNIFVFHNADTVATKSTAVYTVVMCIAFIYTAVMYTAVKYTVVIYLTDILTIVLKMVI